MASKQIYDDSATIVSVFSTELNSFASGNMVVSTGVTPGGELFCDLELAVQYATTTPSLGDLVATVYFLASVDGTNYPEGSTTVFPQASDSVATFHSRNPSISGVERLVARHIQLPARTFKVLIRNNVKASDTWASSGNTLKLKPYKFNLNG